MSSTVSAAHAEPAPYPSAGVCQMEVADGDTSRFPVIVLYPSAADAAPIKLGQYTEMLAADGPVVPGKHRLVVVSHGSGGTPLTHRLLAATLARHGNLVALIEHPGNRFSSFWRRRLNIASCSTWARLGTAWGAGQRDETSPDRQVR